MSTSVRLAPSGPFVDIESSGGALRADWCVSPSSATFAPDQPGPLRSVVFEPDTLTGIEAGDTIFFPASTCLVGAFHSGSAAPEYGGLYDVVSKVDDELTVERSATMATASQIAGVAIVACDAGTGAGVYQIATPVAAVVDTDPQVHYTVSLAPPSEGSYALQSNGGLVEWVVLP